MTCSSYETTCSKKDEISCYFTMALIILNRKYNFEINIIHLSLIILTFLSKKLTKNGRAVPSLQATWNKLKCPSESATPNLLPCWEKRTRVTLANVPGGLGVATAVWWPHSHNETDPSCDPVKSKIGNI